MTAPTLPWPQVRQGFTWVPLTSPSWQSAGSRRGASSSAHRSAASTSWRTRKTLTMWGSARCSRRRQRPTRAMRSASRASSGSRRCVSYRRSRSAGSPRKWCLRSWKRARRVSLRSTRSSRVPTRKVRHACWLPPSESEIGRALRFTAAPVAFPSLRPVRFPRLAIHLGEERRTQKQIDQLGVELRPASFGDRPRSFLEALRMTVPAPVDDCIEAVGDCDNPRLERDFFPLQAERISGSIPALVVRGDAFPQLRIKSDERLEDLRAALGMGHHRQLVFGAQLPDVVADVRQGLVELADVVEERDALDAAEHPVVEIGGLGEDE